MLQKKLVWNVTKHGNTYLGTLSHFWCTQQSNCYTSPSWEPWVKRQNILWQEPTRYVCIKDINTYNKNITFFPECNVFKVIMKSTLISSTHFIIAWNNIRLHPSTDNNV